MSSLYELSGQLLELQSMMEDEGLDPETLADTLEGLTGEYDMKIENYCRVIRNLEAKVDSITTECKRLTARKSTIESNIKRLKDYMFDSMKSVNRKKIDGELFTISIQKNGGKLPLEWDVDVDELPDELCTIERKANGTAARELLDNGGKSKYCHYGERGESLRIR